MANRTKSGVSTDTVEELIDLMGSQTAVAEAHGVSRAHVSQCLRRAKARRKLEEPTDTELRLEDIL